MTPAKSTGTTDKLAETSTEAGSENTVVTPAAEKKTEKARSQSRKRQSIFGKFVAKKDEVEEKREVKKDEKAEKKPEKVEEKEENKAEKAEVKEAKKEEKEAMKEQKAEAKEEKREEKGEQKAEKEAEKGIKKEGEAAMPTGTLVHCKLRLAYSNGDTIVNGEAAKTGITTTPTAPKTSKRNSVFGSFFNKKETAKEKEKDLAPAVPAKDAEPVPVAATAPQIEEPVTTKSEEPTMNVTLPTEGTIDTPVAATSAGETMATKTTATTPDAKEKRRQSFFNLGGKKEKKSEATSDSEGAEKSGSATAKLGNVFRRASRSAKPASSTVTDSGVPPQISKDTTTATEPTATEPMASENNPATAETTMNESAPATVSASA